MIVFISGGQQLRAYQSPYIGQLLNPNSGNRPMTDMAWAADNAAFSGFHEGRYSSMLQTVILQPDRSRLTFVVAPDVVGSADDTRALFRVWGPRLNAANLPVAYVLQDGETPDGVPWGDIAAVFVGGSTAFKESPDAARLVIIAKKLGKWAHMGRVNSIRRARYAQSIGCDSIDGYQFSAFKDTYIEKYLPFLATRQPTIGEIYELQNRVSDRDVPRGGATRKSHRRRVGAVRDDS